PGGNCGRAEPSLLGEHADACGQAMCAPRRFAQQSLATARRASWRPFDMRPELLKLSRELVDAAARAARNGEKRERIVDVARERRDVARRERGVNTAGDRMRCVRRACVPVVGTGSRERLIEGIEFELGEDVPGRGSEMEPAKVQERRPAGHVEARRQAVVCRRRQTVTVAEWWRL